MPIVFAAVMPHGDELIPGQGDGQHASPKLTRALEESAAAAKIADPDVVVLATPHGLRVDRAHSVCLAQELSGELGSLQLEAQLDRDLSVALLASAAARGIEMCAVVYGGESIAFPMDWGSFIPLWFLRRAKVESPVVLICPSRSFELENLALLGEAVAELADETGRRVAFVASADQAHAHDPNGPYGFHASASEFDRQVLETTKSGDLEKFLVLDERLIQEALPDSPWQLGILAGIHRRCRLDPISVVYDRPSYFGMMSAHFKPCP